MNKIKQFLHKYYGTYDEIEEAVKAEEQLEENRIVAFMENAIE